MIPARAGRPVIQRREQLAVSRGDFLVKDHSRTRQ